MRLQADVDRRATLRSDASSGQVFLSALRDRDRYVLLGEPGSGKSSAFLREASAAGTEVVTARRFVGGKRPTGTVAFIDALEEYRIGEAGVDRLESLIDAIGGSDYSKWRIACRAISLPPTDATRIERELGSFETAQLEPLNPPDQRRILAARGQANPAAFLAKVEAMGGGALLGNPSTLLLLRDTVDRAETPITTRGELLAEATRQMAHEVNPTMPERADRPPPGKIVAAAETACMVLLLSDRTDIWMHGTAPTDARFVTRDDLLPARIDTQALRFALDTSMFSGDGGSFVPTHRFVAEYLAGHALARATAPIDPSTPALPLERAIALLSGDDDRPAPALTGIFAWFVSALASTVHAARARELIRLEPEAVLFHGDAAMLPTSHRRVLLDAVGRADPWFLGGNRGSTGIAGLAGSDIALELAAVLSDPNESGHRRALVLMALGAGRRVPELDAAVEAIFLKEGHTDHYDRRLAMSALGNIRGATPEVDRVMLNAIAGQTSPASVQLRIELLSHLMPHVGVEEVRDTLTSYGRTGDGVMGYARPLGERLVEWPMPELFDEPVEAKRHTGRSRLHETAAVVDMALMAAIDTTLGLTAGRLLRWLENAGFDDLGELEASVRSAISTWLDADGTHEAELFDGIIGRTEAAEWWQTVHQFERLTGRPPSDAIRLAAVQAVEGADAEVDVDALAALAFQLVMPFGKHPELYWRLWHALESEPRAARTFEALCVSDIEGWRTRHAARMRKGAAERGQLLEADRQWYRANAEQVRSGQPRGLVYAAEIYLGYREGDGDKGEERLARWLGDDKLLDAIHAGWRAVARLPGRPASEAGRRSAGTKVHNDGFVALAWADRAVAAGDALDLPPTTLLEIAHGAYALSNDRGNAVRSAALTQLLRWPDAARSLVDFWLGWVAGRGWGLPFDQQLDIAHHAVGAAVERLLSSRPGLREGSLRAALGLAARALPPSRLEWLAARARARRLSGPASRLWDFAAWSLDPAAYPGVPASSFGQARHHAAFATLATGVLGSLPRDVATSVLRAGTIVEAFGPVNPPGDRLSQTRPEPSGLVASAIEQLADSPSTEATKALGRLAALPGLAAWEQTLRNAAAKQLSVRRQAAFKPPEPGAVAAALLAGPPATPGDLRAVVGESLRELAFDIRHGDTSPWKGFWNRPTATQANPESRNTPKIENDCRDLLTDRLSDRLRRFGVPVRLIQTEDRSGDDRRADVIILAGDGSAALPIEVKRHWNAELWTAVDDQLVSYCRTAGSNGHGIYLVFWFGNKWKTPANKDVDPRPASAAELQVALIARLSTELARTISVVVVDVSDAG